MTTDIPDVPVFPLPGVVLFPGVSLPLHVFEPRYRTMTRDALRGDRLMAVTLPRPGWESLYQGVFPVHDVGCLGRIEDERELEDGRFTFTLVGHHRVRFEHWTRETPYRVARCAPFPEREPPAGSDEARNEAVRLAATFQALLHQIAGLDTPVGIADDLPLRETVNRICFAIEMEPEDKQTLLLLNDLMVRARRVGRLLDEAMRAVTEQRSGEDPRRTN